MEKNLVKGRPPYPIETIAVAAAFSPRIEGVIAESAKLAKTLNSRLIYIHVGEKEEEKEKKLSELINKYCQGINYSVLWLKGEPVSVILDTCKKEIVDLLMLGALETENIIKHYLGSVARNISRSAKCSVWLMTAPSVNPRKIKKIIVNGNDHPKTPHTICTAMYLSSRLEISEIAIVKESSNPVLAMATAEDITAPEVSKLKKEISQSEEVKLSNMVAACEVGNVRANTKIISGKPGYAIASYARKKQADLLIVNSPDSKLGLIDRLFTHDMEYILADLPCDVLIVHSRING
jgi:nucleotide-binding universal stress UspA family protein